MPLFMLMHPSFCIATAPDWLEEVRGYEVVAEGHLWMQENLRTRMFRLRKLQTMLACQCFMKLQAPSLSHHLQQHCL